MKKGQIYEGVVDAVKFPNKGQIVFEEKCEEQVKKTTVQIKNVLCGQTVRFVVNKIRKGRAEARLLEVLKPSPVECASKCRHFQTCGGCTYQNLPYEEQLKLKAEQVKELLDLVVSDYQFEGILASPVQYEYRNKMEFSFGDEVKDGPLALGLHKRGSFYDIVTVEDCQIVDSDYRKILTATIAYFKEKDTPFYHKMTHEGYLRHLLVRKGAKTGEILIDLITSSQTPQDTICMEKGLVEDWMECILALTLEGKIVGILHTTNDSLSDTVRDDATKCLYGRAFFEEELLGLRFKISPFSFFQTNSLGAEVLYQAARDYVGNLAGGCSDKNGCGDGANRDKIVFDLYSGTGTIAQLLAPVAKKVIGVEIVEEAVEAAKQNAKLNGLDNCEFIAGDVLKVLDEIEEKPDFIVLDPPRDGIHPKAIGKIIAYGVDRIIYISCKPTSLVRDLEIFIHHGYKVEKAVAIDQFPGTVHVETCVLLSHKNS